MSREDGRRMAILMRYEQVARNDGGGLALVAREFKITPERVRTVVKLERRIAASGDRLEIRTSLSTRLRRKLYGG